ncbi:Indole-3-glycerol phosphate synthase [Leucobacter aridicollis]|uniref:indole-3-glycerol-phosphate synthase n=1 Tax=Leucobacter aridicollis TaxID=283878 RepID=A0A852RIR9_9MICO|nr:indole-3-glycerol phosphate synthase TrpC [Leucobacter aridicollis]MBL3683807.1 indole-3-glycerol phosphate synthase TrpC [Leucobacter aridicollis]MCS3428543.1 indole-3-glycerol phosphate synthase [Leucobacter aridicollis]NYD26582.1 indole-3-glycerol phosphate synthase [Leucobacter aridicollis]RKQ84036.1 indole-3-glycerol phosphate synthase [Mycolicibacterium mucogenicum 261Sha1.1M5]
MLDQLLQGSLEDAKSRRQIRPYAAVEAEALARPTALDALAHLAPADHIRVIAEVKRASPSRGDLAEIAEPHALASQYEAGGASVVSVLTEERKFKGSLDDLEAVRKAVSIPVLRKEFIGEEYQILEARAAGADLVLLIVAALPQETLERLYAFTLELGMTPLVEAHSADEVARSVDLGAQLIGVNARDLSTFELDRDLFGRVADQIPAGVIRVAESAVLGVDDVVRYREAGADAILVGEALVTSDPIATLASFLSV